MGRRLVAGQPKVEMNGVVTLKASQNVVAHHGSVFFSAIGRFERDKNQRAGRDSDTLLSDPRDSMNRVASSSRPSVSDCTSASTSFQCLLSVVA